MFFRAGVTRCALVVSLATGAIAAHAQAASSCVWKVTSASGETLFLGGSMHALRQRDYPLPAAYNRAFDASDRIVFEVDDKAIADSTARLMKAGAYPKGDNLRKHVDPRTYDTVRRFFAQMRVPEAQFARYRPWFIVLGLQSPESRGFSGRLGVDQYLLNRARANRKPVAGLETMEEHLSVFAGLNDRQSELLLLFTLFPQATRTEEGMPWLQAWRRGDADRIATMMHQSYANFPAFDDRLLGMRNRRWVPKIEDYLQSGHTYFVVAGAAHFGGADGVLALLRGRGYQITQL